MDAVIKRLNAIKPLKKPLESRLRSIAVEKLFSKNEIILNKGEVNNHAYFIEQGLVCSFSQRRKRIDIQWIRKENDFFGGVYHFVNQTPSNQTIIALEASRLWAITYEQLADLRQSSPRFLWYSMFLTMEYWANVRERSRDLGSTEDKDKLKFLQDTDPDFLQRVPAEYLAPYLGLKKKTLLDLQSLMNRDCNDIPDLRVRHNLHYIGTIKRDMLSSLETDRSETEDGDIDPEDTF